MCSANMILARYIWCFHAIFLNLKLTAGNGSWQIFDWNTWIWYWKSEMISRKKLTNVIFFLYYLCRCWFHKSISLQSSCRTSQISSCSTNYVQTTHFHEQRITTGMVCSIFIYYLFIPKVFYSIIKSMSALDQYN